MKLLHLIRMIEDNTSHTKICFDLKSDFLQLSDAQSNVIFYGQITDITEGVLIHEIIPALQEAE